MQFPPVVGFCGGFESNSGIILGGLIVGFHFIKNLCCQSLFFLFLMGADYEFLC